jgi:hypothetical protein
MFLSQPGPAAYSLLCLSKAILGHPPRLEARASRVRNDPWLGTPDATPAEMSELNCLAFLSPLSPNQRARWRLRG